MVVWALCAQTRAAGERGWAACSICASHRRMSWTESGVKVGGRTFPSPLRVPSVRSVGYRRSGARGESGAPARHLERVEVQR